MRIVSAAIVMGIVGCSAPSTIDVGYTGSDAGFAAAVQAADVWNKTCKADLIHVHRGDGDVAMIEQDGETRSAFGETTIERPVLGIIGEKRATHIWFMKGDYALPTIAHEFGHALGLGHTDHGIMQPSKEWEQLDPSTARTTIRPEEIGPEQCSMVR